MDVHSLPKTFTRQRRGCDLNPGPSAPESSTLNTLGYRATPVYLRHAIMDTRRYCYCMLVVCEQQDGRAASRTERRAGPSATVDKFQLHFCVFRV